MLDAACEAWTAGQFGTSAAWPRFRSDRAAANAWGAKGLEGHEACGDAAYVAAPRAVRGPALAGAACAGAAPRNITPIGARTASRDLEPRVCSASRGQSANALSPSRALCTCDTYGVNGAACVPAAAAAAAGAAAAGAAAAGAVAGTAGDEAAAAPAAGAAAASSRMTLLGSLCKPFGNGTASMHCLASLPELGPTRSSDTPGWDGVSEEVDEKEAVRTMAASPRTSWERLGRSLW